MIEELTQKLCTLKEQKGRIDSEAYEWAAKRNKLNDQVKNLQTETQRLRAERDRINEKVRELKQQRNETSEKIHEKTEEIRKLGQENKDLAKRKPSRSHQALQKEAESIDWRIQTSSLTSEEYKELVEQVKQLETQLAVHKKLEQFNQKIFELRAEIKALKTTNERRHQQLTDNAQESQQIHRRMLEKIEQSKKLKADADNMHKQFVEVKERTKPLQEEIAVIANQLRLLKGEIQQEEQKERQRGQEALRETLEKQAREKLKRGEKLSWEEFQLLAEKGVASED
jgi:phosphoserine phosphatase